ncbi:uncharacterized protein FFUJ_08968 [Fusarium fujikuroi IMI 58289]|uniref:BZIP domain-containing protein n=1 Tax=Gibberella fujikuroi (strain CBS 195.34 / IMI 58289 / NRRL A-6831) TaxID=1279085 RepID=S0EDD5_GIBF5|nr:uncharacterized protein FFUJ_08968 [Fusarium fujikuroi IMI 58289]CCT71852.1 uncharacterized protein FFUJ_08968 [Fusarium fujikuroi IMI 58289]
MDGPSQDFGDQAQSFQDNFPMTSDDVNIDPLLDCTTGAQASPIVSNPMNNQLLMGSNMWNPMNNPVNFFPPSMPAMAPSALDNSPKQQSHQDTTQTAISGPCRQAASKKAPKEPSLKEEDEDEDDGLDETQKRSKFLKRNRIAASKCRQKKKVWIRELEETTKDLEIEHNALHSQYTDLMGELTTIKNQLMDHASCNDANINQWLDNEAKKYVQRIAAQSRQPSPVPPQNVRGEFYNMHRRSSSGMPNLAQAYDP